MNRRDFLKAAGAASLAVPGCAALEGGSPHGILPEQAKGRVSVNALEEPAREVPVVDEVDVLVAGGGPAGVAAAVASARTGAATRLVETQGCLGGIWTAGLMSYPLDSRNKPGLMREIASELDGRGARAKAGRRYAFDVEATKLYLEELCLGAGVRIRLHTRVVAAHLDGTRLSAAVTESKSGREAWRAKAFVDATGDGDLAARAGCEFDLGREGTGETQPMSLIAILCGLSPEELWEPASASLGDHAKWLLGELARVGIEPSYAKPTLFHVSGEVFMLMANHEYRVSAVNADDVTAATVRARAEVNRIVSGLRSLGGVWRNVRLVATGAQIGTREGRRVRGIYTVTKEDLATGARHDDAVCRVTFGVDIHSPDPEKSKGFDHGGVRARPYDIPLRALVARDVGGLVTAGRCISGDFVAHSSYRVTGNSVRLGEAAGTLAALAAATGRAVCDVPFAEVNEAMSRAAAGA